jgi:hypothetical protein
MADEVRRLAAPLTVPEGFVALYRREAEFVLRSPTLLGTSSSR